MTAAAARMILTILGSEQPGQLADQVSDGLHDQGADTVLRTAVTGEGRRDGPGDHHHAEA